MPDTPEKDAARDAVIASIAAFDGVGRGNGTTLHEATAIDYCRSDKIRLKARRLDTETRWQDVTDATIKANPTAIHFLDAEGFRYYIPALILYALNGYDSANTQYLDFSLTVFQRDPHDLRQFGLLNDAQRRAICQFIRFYDLVEREQEAPGWPNWNEAEVALRFGWRQYCESD